MCRFLNILGVAVDGGKDSLSMAAKVKTQFNSYKVVKSPSTIVISTYALVPNIRVKVTPLLIGNGKIVYLNLNGSRSKRLSASALAQVYGQIEDDCPNITNPNFLKLGFESVQNLINLVIVLQVMILAMGG